MSFPSPETRYVIGSKSPGDAIPDFHPFGIVVDGNAVIRCGGNGTDSYLSYRTRQRALRILAAVRVQLPEAELWER